MTLGGQQTISQTTSFDAKLGIDVAGIEIGGGVKKDNSRSITLSQSVEYQIPPGRQAVYVAGTAHRFETGRIQVNYGSPQYEHYIVSAIVVAWMNSEDSRLTSLPAL